MLMNPIRNSIKAIIIKDNRILCTKNKDHLGIFYLLPGGGQRPGELMKETLKRECREEIGADIKMGDLIYVREYIGKNHEFSEHEQNVHQIEYMFECELKEENVQKKAISPDQWQIGIEWINLDQFFNYRFYPKELTKFIKGKGKFFGKTYLGDIN